MQTALENRSRAACGVALVGDIFVNVWGLVAVVIVSFLLYSLAKSGWLRAGVLTVQKGVALRIEGVPQEERWVTVERRDIKEGDTQNTKPQWIPITVLRHWRIRYGTHPLPQGQGGHLTIRVYGDLGRLVLLKPVRKRKLVLEVVDLQEPRRTTSDWIHVQKRWLLLVHVDPKTEWWTLEIQQKV